MPLDSRIPLQVQQVQLPDFNALAQQRLANTQNVMAMKAGMQAQQKQEAIKQAYQSSIGPDGQVDYKRLVPAIGQIDPQLGMQVQEHVADIEQKQMTAKKSQLEYGIAQADVAHKDIMLARSATELAPIIARHLEAGDIKDDEARAILGQATSAPDFSAWQRDFGTRLMDMKDQLAAQHAEMTLGETIRSNKADEGHAAAALAETTRDHAASRAIQIRGQNMTDARARDGAATGGGRASAANMKAESSLRKEFDNLPEVKNFRTVRGQFQQIQSQAAKPNAQNDIAMIFSYMKMLDPTSVVREGEFATAQNAAGVPDRIRNLANKSINGERLNPQQRAMMVKSGAEIYKAQRDIYNERAGQFRSYAADNGVAPERVAQRYIPNGKKSAPKATGKIDTRNPLLGD